MPTPEESGVAKPKRGPCENCGGPSGRRRRMHRVQNPAYPGTTYVLCSKCAQAMGASHTVARRGRHAHGGKPGRLV